MIAQCVVARCAVFLASGVRQRTGTMWEPGPFPKKAMKRVQRLEGNSVCMDCGQPETSWGGATYGILLCVTCAGRHRSLGTHLTVIKSLTMDRWDAAQVRRMELGGNGQLRAWFKKCRTENSALEMKYRTKAATLYRENLREAADEDLASGAREGETEISHERAAATSKGRIFAAAERAAASDLAREEAAAAAAAAKMRRKGGKNSRSSSSSRRRRDAERTAASHNATAPSPTPATHAVGGTARVGGGSGSGGAAVVGSGMEEPARRCGKEEEYEVVFGPGGMGFTLMKDAVSRALVTRLAPGGMAFRLGVKTGDYLVGVDGHRLFDYDQLMLLLPRAPRPLRLLFEGAGAAFAASPTARAGKVAANGFRGPGGVANASDSSSYDSSSSSSSKSSGSSSSSSSSSSSNTSSDDNDVEEEENAKAVRPHVSGDDKERAASPIPGRAAAASDADTTAPPPPPPLPNGTPGKTGEESGEEGRLQARAIAGVSEKIHTNDESSLDNGHAGSAGAARHDPATREGTSDQPTTRSEHTAKPQAHDDAARRERIPSGDVAPDAAAPGAAAGGTARTAEVTPLGETEEQGGPPRQGKPPDGEVVDASAEAVAATAAAKEDVETVPGAEDAVVEDAAVSVGSQAKRKEREEHAVVRTASLAAASSQSSPHEVVQEAVGREGAAKSGGVGDGTKNSGDDDDGDEVAASSGGGRSSKGKGVDCGGSSSRGGKGAGSELVEGSKVTVQDKKRSSKWRKGLLRRRHGDGSWTVRYSGGMEERRVAFERVRLRSPEGASSSIAAPTAVTGTIAAGALGAGRATAGGSKNETRKEARKEGDEEGRRRSRKSTKGKEKRPSAAAVPASGRGNGQRHPTPGNHTKGGGGGGGGSTNGWKDPVSAPRSWASVDGNKDVQEGFRAPGELRDDFFADSDGGRSTGSSDAAGGSVLAAYARLDPSLAAAATPPAFAPPPSAPVPSASAYAGGYAAPRRMEGFGGGGGGGGGGWEGGARGGAASGEMASGRFLTGVPAQQPAQPRGHTVVFPEGGMGLTLTKELAGGCSVTRVVPGGVAHSRGVVVGQHVCAVNGQPSGTYEQTMAVIAGSPRPISITFVMPVVGGGSGGGNSGNRFSGVGGGPPMVQQSWADVGLAATITAMDAANAVAVEWGLGASTPGVLDNAQPSSAASIPPPPEGFRVHQKHSLMAIPTGVAGGFGNSLAKHRTFAVDVSPDMPTMSTKKALSEDPGAEEGEFDVRFGEGELGMRLEERGSFKASSVVVKITEDGQAMSLGIREGCTVVGINGEKYLSHAHTVATLKHAKRPVAVRFRAPEGPGGRRR